MDSNIKFFTEYAHDPHRFSIFFHIYEKVERLSMDYLQQRRENLVIDSTRAYRHVPILMVRTDPIDYSVDDLLQDEMTLELIEAELQTEYGGNVSIRQASQGSTVNWVDKVAREAAWRQDMTPDMKMNVLTTLGKYHTFKENSLSPDIVNLEVYEFSGKLLQYGTEYAIRKNKLFLIKNYERNYRHGILFIKNMTLDMKLPELLLQQFMPFKYLQSFSRAQYKDILQMFLKNAMIGAQLNALNESFAEYDPEHPISVYDFYSASDANKLQWVSNPEDDWRPEFTKYSIFDGVVELPEDYIVDTANMDDSRITYILQFLRLIRPAHVFLNAVLRLPIDEQVAVDSDHPQVNLSYGKEDVPLTKIVVDATEYKTNLVFGHPDSEGWKAGKNQDFIYASELTPAFYDRPDNADPGTGGDDEKRYQTARYEWRNRYNYDDFSYVKKIDDSHFEVTFHGDLLRNDRPIVLYNEMTGDFHATGIKSFSGDVMELHTPCTRDFNAVIFPPDASGFGEYVTCIRVPNTAAKRTAKKRRAKKKTEGA